jgi:pimeloyl-ACP methyl ester carboxylesterase
MSSHQTLYTKTHDGLEIGYQVDGSGSRDIVLVTNNISNIEVMREQPLIDQSLNRLTKLGRLVVFDRLGSGVSDPLPSSSPDLGPTIEQGAADILSVLDALSIERAHIVSTDLGGWPALMFAATYPERVESLVLSDSTARLMAATDYPIGMPAEFFPPMYDSIEATYGHGGFLILAPTLYEDLQIREWGARYERMSCPRATMLSVWRSAADLDLRALLPLIQCPTLVLHHRTNPLLAIEHGRYLQENIPGSAFVELEGDDTLFFADGRIFDEVLRWIGGIGPAEESDRSLATVMFTDVIASTETAARLGDAKWRSILDAHDTVVERVVKLGRGQVIKSTGDGILATFDGPARAVRSGVELMRSVTNLGIDIRCGIHTGEVEVRGKDIGGIAVHIAARVMSQGGAENVVVSRTVKDLTSGSGIEYASTGMHHLKGVPDEWELFHVLTT